MTDYNAEGLAQRYGELDDFHLRPLVETYSLLKLIGDVRGKKVLDVACGEGYYSRILRQAGADRVLGIDIAERMIALAREQEARQPLGIDYRTEDARTPSADGDFDLVVAAWLLCEAGSRADLLRMCRGLASRVRPGSRFVTVTTNPNLYRYDPLPDYQKYGVAVKLEETAFDGAPMTFTIHNGDAAVELVDRYLPMDAYETALVQAGFRDVTVHMPEVAPAARERDGSYWDDFLQYPTLVLIECVKAQ